jgi:hypothetical protein
VTTAGEAKGDELRIVKNLRLSKMLWAGNASPEATFEKSITLFEYANNSYYRGSEKATRFKYFARHPELC